MLWPQSTNNFAENFPEFREQVGILILGIVYEVNNFVEFWDIYFVGKWGT